MHVDHVDGDTGHNVIGNLVASCPRCNQWRDYERTANAIRQARGRVLTAFGRTQCLSEWAREFQISRPSIVTRLNKGWSPERAVSEPRGKFGPQRGSARPQAKGARDPIEWAQSLGQLL
jgi:hypothetical protein